MLFRFFSFCIVMTLASTLTYGQQANSDTKKTFDNYDVIPNKAIQLESTVEKSKEKPKEKVTEKSAEKTEIKQPEKISTNNTTNNSVSNEEKITDKSYKNKSPRSKSAVLKTPTKRNGEGYWQDETPVVTQSDTPPPPPKIYSEVHTSITEKGSLMLTSDTVVVKPTIATKAIPVALTESTGDTNLDDIIQKAAKKNEVDPRLILEVIRQESGFRLRAVSHKGASGLMQLIPSTARRFGVTDIFDREQNINAGTRYLKLLLDMFGGNLELALAGYNAGEHAVVRYNYAIPPYRETRDYVRRITTRYRSRYHQVTTAIKVEPIVVHQVPLATFAAENGRVVLSNNY
ncbi:MAG: lytic transglycosylase domain-containing protein [Blastocatellia bacterium]